MAKSFGVLKTDAQTIKNERQEGKNTANRIGSMFVDVVDKMESDAEATAESLLSLQEEDKAINAAVKDANDTLKTLGGEVAANKAKIETVYKGDLGDLSGTKCSDFIRTIQTRMGSMTGATGADLYGRYTFSVRGTESKQEIVYSLTGSKASYRLRGGLLPGVLNSPNLTIDGGNTSTFMRELIYDSTALLWYDISLPVKNEADAWMDYFLEDLDESPDSLNSSIFGAGEVMKVGQYVSKKIKTLTPVDVTALLTEGGRLTAEEAGGSLSTLLNRPLYVKSHNYNSTVYVSVTNQKWYLVAHRIGYSEGVMYRIQRVAECTITEDVMTTGTVKEFNLEASGTVGDKVITSASSFVGDNDMKHGVVYYSATELTDITIENFETPDKNVVEYVWNFKTGANPVMSLPSYLYWANGEVPEIEGGTVYELSITATKYADGYVYKAILVPFRSV